MIRLVYFAWVRELVGTAEEELDLPPEVASVGALLDWLGERDAAHAEALADRSRIRVAVNQDYAAAGDPVRPGDEVAVFPPVTGG